MVQLKVKELIIASTKGKIHQHSGKSIQTEKEHKMPEEIERLSITFIDLLEALEEGREGEIARSEKDVLTIHAVYTNAGIKPDQPFLLRFSHPQWRIIIKNANDEVVEEIDVYQPFFFVDPVRFRGLWEIGLYKLIAEAR